MHEFWINKIGKKINKNYINLNQAEIKLSIHPDPEMKTLNI